MQSEKSDEAQTFVIVDDVPDDRRSLAWELGEISPDNQIIELGSAEEMARYLSSGEPAAALFLDLNLHGVDTDYMSEGLISLYEWWETRPDVPVCIVSGYVGSSACDILEASFSIPSLVDTLDKLRYRNADVRRALARAAEHRSTYQAKKEHERSVQESREALAKKRSRIDPESKDAFGEAFSGGDWRRRIAAEQRLGGTATLNGIKIFLRTEAALREVFSEDEWKAFPQHRFRLLEFTKRTGAMGGLYERMSKRWELRCKVIHKPYLEMSDTDALRALEDLEEVLQLVGKLVHAE